MSEPQLICPIGEYYYIATVNGNLQINSSSEILNSFLLDSCSRMHYMNVHQFKPEIDLLVICDPVITFDQAYYLEIINRLYEQGVYYAKEYGADYFRLEEILLRPLQFTGIKSILATADFQGYIKISESMLKL